MTSDPQHKVTKEQLTWFMFQKTKYTLEEGQFRPLQFPVNLCFQDYHSWRGYSDENEVAAARTTYGKNRWGGGQWGRCTCSPWTQMNT